MYASIWLKAMLLIDKNKIHYAQLFVIIALMLL